MRESSSILPLIAPQSTFQSRDRRSQKFLSWSICLRYLSRRRLKFYLCLIALFIILAVTIVHRIIITTNQSHTVGKHKHKQNKPNVHPARFEARTLKTIIGTYVGPKPEWADMTAQNISAEVINANNYDPDPDIGRDGRPAYLPAYPKDQMRLLYSINRFNLAASDKISVDRKLPDARKMACRKKAFEVHSLPSTSIIIVFHNEAWSTLARTVHSILNTAPQPLLAEIILVDDASNRTFLGKTLEYYMNNLGSIRGVDIRIYRSKDRIGLIKSRLLGVAKARGSVLTFIDAHCEATTGWLEPLLEQVQLNPRTAACPIIDIINEDTFAFTRSFELHLGAFNWGLNFRWYPISRRELVASNGFNKREGKVKLTELVHPFHTPVMAGGLFSIDRNFFNEMGQYDPQMDIWGGENIELSLRLWQCGGQVKIVPCSHVGHVFRKSSPYTFRPGKEVGDILYSNLARVSEVWMDEWREFFYLMNPIVNKTLHKVGRQATFKDIEARKQLRARLGCKNFSWFLDNVWPEHFFPKSDRFFGKLKLKHFDRCLQRPTVRIGMGQAAVGAVETVANCSSSTGQHQHQQGLTSTSNELFVYNEATGFLVTDENICLDSGSDPIPTRQVILSPCSESKRQKWSYDREKWLIKHEQSNLCLDSPSTRRVQLEVCDPARLTSRWLLMEEKWNTTIDS